VAEAADVVATPFLFMGEEMTPTRPSRLARSREADAPPVTGCRHVLGFDQDFAAAGFTLWR
jgi:hypothetical protein